MSTTSLNKINLLDEVTRELIAAGEVIERPLSAVKELVENSIDAGSSKITVELKLGGHRQIIVTDDGCGMSKDDALICLQRFATSKIKKIEDLEALSSLGFRGEALPSIAAVAKVEIYTNDAPSKLGTHIKIEGGKIIAVKEAPFQRGAKIEVSDLFFNTPARRKFQKSAATEFMHIYNLINKFAFYYKNIHFVLIHNDKESVNFPSQLDALTKYCRFIKEEKDNFINIEAQKDHLKISGFLSRPPASKKTRDAQVIFVNGRIIKLSAINQALNNAYSQFLEKGAYPPALLFIEIAPSFIDVNVHPTKSEVRFADNSFVYNAVYGAVLQKLRQISSPAAYDNYAPPSYAGAGEKPGYDAMRLAFSGETEEEASYSKPESFGQINETYAYAVMEDSIFIFDIHAACERINYEKLKNKLISNDASGQKLLTPVVLEVTKKQLHVLNEQKQTFQKLGFEIDVFGKDEIIINAVPQNLEVPDINAALQELLCELEEEYFKYKSLDEARDNLIKQLACKTSVKSGDNLNYYELKKVFEDLNKTEHPSNCPHGRPTFVKFTNKELDKMFKRV